jgi:hypothetical protein
MAQVTSMRLSPQLAPSLWSDMLLGDDSEVGYLLYCIYFYMILRIGLYLCLFHSCLYSVVLVQ